MDPQKAISLSVADISVGIDNPRYDRDSKKNCCRPDQKEVIWASPHCTFEFIAHVSKRA